MIPVFLDKKIGYRSIQTLHKPPCTGNKIKDNGVDKVNGGIVVYKRYMRFPHLATKKN